MRGILARAYRSFTRFRHHAAVAAASLIESLEPRELLATYYVSNSGNDWASGTGWNTAWRSIDRVNGQHLKPGDNVLFEGGGTFNGSLYIPSKEGGNSWAPVTISTYGHGRANINSGSQPGLDVAQTAGVSLSNINFRGNGMHNNRSHGIHFHSDWSNQKLSYIRINDVDVSGYGGYNIKIAAPAWNSSFSDIRITGAELHDSREGGLWINASQHNANKNVYIARVKAYNHPGTGQTGKVSGNGIFVADVDGAIIERSVAFNNGARGAAPVGIWVAGSNRVTVQYNESYGNKTMTGTDGGGFDFDWDVTNSVMQYNFSHDNHGPGYLLCAQYKRHDGNVVRYNISQNDARTNGRGGIHLYGNVRNTKIHNNVVFITPTGNGDTAAFVAHDLGAGGTKMSGVDVRDNIFVSTGGVKLVRVTGVFSKEWSNRFAGNAYYSSGQKFKIDWNGQNFSTIKGFRSTGQERFNGYAVGYSGHPRLQGIGTAPTLNDANRLGELWQYKLQKKSILKNRGVGPNPTLSSGTTDFFGGALPKSGRYDVGVHEMA